jgi:2-polyprenyl-3-methyl-5-hydroxy-6-metoxy-1,4-benzoquinol methylase
LCYNSTMIKQLLRYFYHIYLKLSNPRRIAELAGERVVFNELKRLGSLDKFAGKRILEVGPKYGKDSLLLAALNPSELILIDLPEKTTEINQWLPRVAKLCPSKYIEGNLLYLSPEQYQRIGVFDLIWCLGVLYHNVEQIRLLRRLYKLCNDNGLVVIESATTRNKKLENLNVIEVHWPDTYRGSSTVTHLPSRLAIKSWLEMVGFRDVKIWDIYSKTLRWQRAILTATKVEDIKPYISYGESGLNPEYFIGDSL